MVAIVVLCRTYGIIPGDFIAEYIIQGIIIQHALIPNKGMEMLEQYPFVVAIVVVFIEWRWYCSAWPFTNTVKTPLLIIPAAKLQACFCWPGKKTHEYAPREEWKEHVLKPSVELGRTHLVVVCGAGCQSSHIVEKNFIEPDSA
jgi:hypothetical protein